MMDRRMMLLAARWVAVAAPSGAQPVAIIAGPTLVVRSQRLLPKRWVNRPTKSKASGVYQTVSTVWYTPLGWTGRVRAEGSMIVSGTKYTMHDLMAQFREALDPPTRPTLSRAFAALQA